MEFPPFKPETNFRTDNKQIYKIEHPENHIILSTCTNQSIHTYLYSIIKKSEVLISPGNTSGIKFMEEEALVLCGMMKKEGFFDGSTNDSCVICATEKLEKDLIETMKNQLRIIELARKFYTQPENRLKYNVCANHRPTYATMTENAKAPHSASLDLVTEMHRENKENVPGPSFSFFSLPNENINASGPQNSPSPQNCDVSYFSNTTQASNLPKPNPAADFVNSYFDTPILDPIPSPILFPEFETITVRSKFFPHITQEVNSSSVDYLQNCVFAPPVMLGQSRPHLSQDFFSPTPESQSYASSPNLMQNENVAQNLPSNYGNNFSPISVPSTPPLFNNHIDDNNLANFISNSIGTNQSPRNVSQNFPNMFESRNVLQNTLNLPNMHSQTMNMPLRQNIIQQTVDIIAGDLNNVLENRVGRKILGKRY